MRLKGLLQGLFQSTLPAGGATSKSSSSLQSAVFQSTLPAGGATDFACFFVHCRYQFQSTLPAGGATRLGVEFLRCLVISIHAPRGGSDRNPFRGRIAETEISIHAPRGGSDLSSGPKLVGLVRNFNPRSPRGERRPPFGRGPAPWRHFNPRSPRGERR